MTQLTLSSNSSGNLNDDILTSGEYTNPDFDSQAFVKQLLEKNDVAAAMAKVSFQLTNVQKLLKDHVSGHYEELLDKIKVVQELEGMQENLRKDMDDLTVRFKELKSKISAPYKSICSNICALDNIHQTCAVIRQIQALISLLRKLKSSIKSNDKITAAHTIKLLQAKKSSPSLNHLEKIEKLRDLWTEFDKLTSEFMAGLYDQLSLAISTRTLGDSQLAIASLLILRSYNDIQDHFLERYKTEINNVARGAFDLRALARRAVEKDPSLKTSEGTISVLTLSKIFWNNMIDVFDKIFEIIMWAYTFDQILSRTDQLLWPDIWGVVNSVFEQEVKASGSATPELLQIMQGTGYHRLLRLIGDCQSKMSVQVDDKDKENVKKFTKEFTKCFSSLETAYLSRSLSRMFDPINNAFGVSSKTAVPTIAETTNISKIILSEIDLTKFDENLCSLITRNVGKAINLFVVKCEGMIDNEQSSFNLLTASLNAGIIRNIQVCNILSHFLQSLELDDNQNLVHSFENADKLFDLLFSKMFRMAIKNLELVVGKMHMETSAPNGDPLSICLNELEKSISVFQRDVIIHVTCFSEFVPWMRALLQRIIIVFTISTSLLKPIPSGLKVNSDRFLTMISSLASSFQIKKDELEDNVAMLKSLIQFSDMDVDKLAELSLSESTQITTAVHHLFSRGPSDLKPPHKGLNITIEKYINWMDQHSFDEWKSLVERSLNNYVKEADSQGLKTYAQEYVIILRLLKRI